MLALFIYLFILFIYMGNFSYISFAGFFLFSFLFYLRSLSYTSRAGFILIWGVSLTHPMLASLFNMGSVFYTSRAGFIFMWGVSLKHTVLALIFIWGVCLTHPTLTLFLHGEKLPMLASFSSGEFLLDIPCRLRFLQLGSFSYTSRAGFFSYRGSFS